MQIESGLEQVGVAGKPHCREIAAIGAAPDPNLAGINVAHRLQILRSCNDILIFGGSRGSSMVRVMKMMPVTDAEAIIHREHDIAMISEVLIHRVAVAVIVHVVPAEQHLSRRTAMDKDQAGFPGARAIVEQLSVDGPAICRFEADGAGHNELAL